MEDVSLIAARTGITKACKGSRNVSAYEGKGLVIGYLCAATRGKVVVPLGRDGSISIEVEGTIFRLHEKTRKIIDILD